MVRELSHGELGFLVSVRETRGSDWKGGWNLQIPMEVDGRGFRRRMLEVPYNGCRGSFETPIGLLVVEVDFGWRRPVEREKERDGKVRETECSGHGEKRLPSAGSEYLENPQPSAGRKVLETFQKKRQTQPIRHGQLCKGWPCRSAKRTKRETH